MTAIVIPVKNESTRLILLLTQLLSNPALGQIYVILNGSTDSTWREIKHLKHKINIIKFIEPLGFDVPRAVGAFYAYQDGAKRVLFVDGDMTGNFLINLAEIKKTLLQGSDLVLTNCYPKITWKNPLATKTIYFRQLLNKELGLYPKIGIASPSHGLVGVSRKFLETIPLIDLAIPPVSLALAKKNNLEVKVGTVIDHLDLGSKIRSSKHAELIAHTIIGDSLEAKCVFKGLPRSRDYHSRSYLGYHPMRRLDILSSLSADWPVK